MNQQLHVNTEDNIRQGMVAIRGVIRSHVDDYRAMFRADIGNVAFYWGKEGDATGRFLGGYGLSKIIAEKGDNVITDIVKAVARGRIARRYGASLSPRLLLEYQGASAVMALASKGKNGESDTWLLAEWIDLGEGDYAPAHGERPFADVVPGVVVEPVDIVQAITEAAGGEYDWKTELLAAASYEDIAAVFGKLRMVSAEKVIKEGRTYPTAKPPNKQIAEFQARGFKVDTNIDDEIIELRRTGKLARRNKDGAAWRVYIGNEQPADLIGDDFTMDEAAAEMLLEKAPAEILPDNAEMITEAALSGDWQALKAIFEKPTLKYAPGMFTE